MVLFIVTCGALWYFGAPAWAYVLVVAAALVLDKWVGGIEWNCIYYFMLLSRCYQCLRLCWGGFRHIVQAHPHNSPQFHTTPITCLRPTS